MRKKIDVVIHCSNSKNRYKECFEERQSGAWYGIGEEKLAPLSFFERLALKSNANRSKKTSFQFKKSSAFSPSSSNKANVRGVFYIGAHKCPYCGNGDFVKCNVCGEWTCSKEGATYFKCAICGNEGAISGQINAASGDLSQNNSKKHT